MTPEQLALYKQILDQNEGFIEINLRILDAIAPQPQVIIEEIDIDAGSLH